MDLSRRDVLKGATAVAAGVGLAGDIKPGLTRAHMRALDAGSMDELGTKFGSGHEVIGMASPPGMKPSILILSRI